MTNNAMRRNVDTGNAIDLSNHPREGKYYILDKFVDDESDYCDASKTAWIWSIGRRRSDGVILASTSCDLYQNPAFECLWLR